LAARVCHHLNSQNILSIQQFLIVRSKKIVFGQSTYH
jgi:hypothetical protein